MGNFRSRQASNDESDEIRKAKKRQQRMDIRATNVYMRNEGASNQPLTSTTRPQVPIYTEGNDGEWERSGTVYLPPFIKRVDAQPNAATNKNQMYKPKGSSNPRYAKNFLIPMEEEHVVETNGVAIPIRLQPGEMPTLEIPDPVDEMITKSLEFFLGSLNNTWEIYNLKLNALLHKHPIGRVGNNDKCNCCTCECDDRSLCPNQPLSEIREDLSYPDTFDGDEISINDNVPEIDEREIETWDVSDSISVNDILPNLSHAESMSNILEHTC